MAYSYDKRVAATVNDYDPWDLDAATQWAAKVFKKTRLWQSLLKRHAGISVSKRDWQAVNREMKQRDRSDPGLNWEEFLASQITPSVYGPVEKRKVTVDFLKRTGIELSKMMEGWTLAGKP